MRKGLTLLELLLVVALSAIVLAGIYYIYSYLVKGYLKESRRATIQIESAVGLEVLRQDVEHAGYGIAVDEPTLPIKVEKGPDGGIRLRIVSTYNLTNKETRGWSIVRCIAGRHPIQVLPILKSSHSPPLGRFSSL